MEVTIYILFFLLGTCVGSFINVLVERTARDESIQGRSYCEFCNKKLLVKDLVPIFSFLSLKGKCRYCNQKLSKQYLLVEIITGISFVIVYYLVTQGLYVHTDINGNLQHLPYYYQGFPLLFYLVVTSSLIALFLSDLKYGMLFDKIILPTILFVIFYKLSTLLYILWLYYNQLQNHELGQYLIQSGFYEGKVQYSVMPFIYTFAGSLGIALFFLLLIIITKGRGMGGGDVKLGILIGLISGWPYMLSAIMIGFLTGSLYSFILVSIRRKHLKQTIPFGPFLILGCIAVMFFGNDIINWYLVQILKIEPLQ